MIPFVDELFGLVIGSFLNVVIHRVPLRQSIIWPSSRCPPCEERIKSFDNLPVLSYLIPRGRCRNCKARISPRYTLVEVMAGLLFMLVGYQFGLSLSSGRCWGALAGGALVATRRIQRRSALPFGVFLALAGVFTLFLGPESWEWYWRLIGAA